MVAFSHESRPLCQGIFLLIVLIHGKKKESKGEREYVLLYGYS